MAVLDALIAGLRLSTIEVIDLTAPLSADTPIIQLPPPFGNTIPFSLQEVSRYDERGPAWQWKGDTPGVSVECARWLAEQSPLIGFGVETVGTDAGAAHSFDPPFPCHAMLLGAGKYGLTQLQNLARLPTTGAVLIAGPLPITGGSGSPCRVLALVEHD
jgi:kynurenine formamidase